MALRSMRKLPRPGEERRFWIAFLLPLIAVSPLAAEPAPSEPPAPSSSSHPTETGSESSSSRPGEKDLEDAVPLSCPGESYRILILSNGSAFLQNLETPEEDEATFQRLPLRDALNPPKSTLTCSGSGFRLRTSPPFSNRSIEQQFSLGTNGIRLIARRESDPAEQIIEDSFQLALRGNREALRSIDYSTIEYIYQYVNAQRFERFLDTALRRCDRAPCQPILESTFYLIVRLSATASGNEYDPDQPSSWVRAIDETGVPMGNAAPALIRYAEILKRQGKLRAAADLLGEMVARESSAPDLHLLYGDLLWDLNEKDAARAQYRLFADLSAREGRPLPVRVARLLDDM